MKSIYAWYIVYLTGPFKPAKNQTNMKKWISLPHCHTINSFYNIASKFVWSNSIAWVCFIFLLCTLMTSANKSLREFCIRSENKVHLHTWIHLSVFWPIKDMIVYSVTKCFLETKLSTCWSIAEGILTLLQHLNHVSVVFEKNLLMLIYSKLQEKNCDYILIIYMKKYEKAYNNYAEAKHAHQVQK